jgi:hypothetical protein
MIRRRNPASACSLARRQRRALDGERGGQTRSHIGVRADPVHSRETIRCHDIAKYHRWWGDRGSTTARSSNGREPKRDRSLSYVSQARTANGGGGLTLPALLALSRLLGRSLGRFLGCHGEMCGRGGESRERARGGLTKVPPGPPPPPSNLIPLASHYLHLNIERSARQEEWWC